MFIDEVPKGNATYGFFPLWNPILPFRRRSLKAHQRESLAIVLPLRRPSRWVDNVRTVLAGKGSLRRAKTRRALACCAPF